MENQKSLLVTMKRSVARTESVDAALRIDGFAEIARLANELPPDTPDETGFFDSALFSARKHANDENESVRMAVVTALAAISGRAPRWREAITETTDEIAAQPAEAPKHVADAVRRQMERA